MLLEELTLQPLLVYTLSEPREVKGDYEGVEVALLGFRGKELTRQAKVLFLDMNDVDNIDLAGKWRTNLVNPRTPTAAELKQINSALAFINTLPVED